MDELTELRAKCLKSNGEPRKNASIEDLERLKELLMQQEAKAEATPAATPAATPGTEPEAEPEPPLTDGEKEELASLEGRARQGRQILMPSPTEMRRLGELRKRNV